MDKTNKSKLTWINRQEGYGIVETAIALALVGVLAVAFLSGLSTASRAVIIADERSTGENLARSQMEFIKNTPYVFEATSYTAADVPSATDYTGYSVVIAAQPLENPDNGVQKITVTVRHGTKDVMTIESYKANR